MIDSLRDAWCGPVTCPFCDYSGNDYCRHMIGWTDNGRRIELRGGGDSHVEKDDRIITTGVTARVYRPEGGAA